MDKKGTATLSRKKTTKSANTEKTTKKVAASKTNAIKTTSKAKADKTVKTTSKAIVDKVVNTTSKAIVDKAAKSDAKLTAIIDNSCATQVEQAYLGADKPCVIKAKKGAKVNKNVVIKKKILYVSSEAAPYSRTGGLGDVAGSLPYALNNLDNDCRVITPLYSAIPSTYKQTMKYIGHIYVPLGWRNQYCGVFEHFCSGVTYYFIDNEYYFKRNAMYGQFDDGERFAFFSKAVLEVLPLIDFIPDIIHCNDWHSALTPVFLDCFYRDNDNYKFIKTIFTIHNIEFQGKYDKYIINDILAIPQDKESLLINSDICNYMKGAIEASNIVTTVSKTYAEEILDYYYAYGLEHILRERQYKLKGVINGIDTDLYNPLSDIALFKNYNLASVYDKAENKKGLCHLLDLPYDKNKPMIGMVTRLTEQKGIDLVATVIEELLCADIQLVVLGTGNWKYETLFSDIDFKYKNKFRAIIKFSEDIASKIYAASDMFLMPSKFEPCGLSQMIALRYGAIPIVRETGGLKDTVKPYDFMTKEGVGFTFSTHNPQDMLGAIWRAVDAYYNNKEDWRELIKNAMSEDNSWNASAKEYDGIYNELLGK